MQRFCKIILIFNLLALFVITCKGRNQTCITPPVPPNSVFIYLGDPDTGPERHYLAIDVICKFGYTYYNNLTTSNVFCIKGEWSPMPSCKRSCRLDRQKTVNHYCSLSGEHQVPQFTRCRLYETEGTKVMATWRYAPDYVGPSLDPPPTIECQPDGHWDQILTYGNTPGILNKH